MRFWLAYIAGFLGFGYILLLGGYTFRGDYTLQLVGFVLALCIALSWLIWRGVIWHDHLPKTGLEWALVAGLAAVFLSLAASPDLRQGLSRSAWLLAYAILFYFFLNLLDTDLDRWGLLAAAMTVTGLFLFQADVETIQWYRSWFEVNGGFVLPPVQYRFIGLMPFSNPLMALANLFVPAVLLAVRRFRQPAVRVLGGLWILLYIFAVPFSSSRGGWLGLAVVLAVSGLYWAWSSQLLGSIRRWRRRKLALVLAGLLVLAVLGAFLGYHFLVEFASHPTHGGDPFGGSGREVFWANAVKIWQSFPWFGTGPDRFAFEYLRVEPAIPPGFWPLQAHDIFLEALAEFGILGLAAFLFFLGAIVRWAWRMLRGSTPERRAWTAAVLAGECGLLVQLAFDDQTTFMAVMVPAIFLLAWVGANTNTPLPTFRRASLGWLSIPIFILIGGAGWGIWAYQPYTQWLGYAQSGDWTRAAEQASISASRDPNYHFYATEAGLLWAWQARYENAPIGLFRARSYFEQALRFEPTTSWNWANLAMMDAASGDLEAAVRHMERAVRLSPNMAAYQFNLGKFYEGSNLPEVAIASYQKALDLRPDWRDLPFWGETETRAQALNLWQANPPSAAAPENTFWHQAQSAIADRNLDEADVLLAKARLMSEPAVEIARSELLLAEARGSAAGVDQARQRLRQLADEDQKALDYGVVFFYPLFLTGKNGTGIMAVPGLVPEMDYSTMGLP